MLLLPEGILYNGAGLEFRFIEHELVKKTMFHIQEV